jgi:hypothetical protein
MSSEKLRTSECPANNSLADYPANEFSLRLSEATSKQYARTLLCMFQLFSIDESASSYPFLPELNDFYRREACRADGIRSGRNGLGVITDVRTNSLILNALRRRSLIVSIFDAFGMKAKASEAGRIASRLIQQMGGVQGCRVFKITGVRSLIEKYKPFQSFTRGDATQIIGEVDPKTGDPNFTRYESLFIGLGKKRR